MNASQVRAWLQSGAGGRALQVPGVPGVQPQGERYLPRDNASFRQFFPALFTQNGQTVTVTRTATAHPRDGAFLPFLELGCPSVNLTLEGLTIVISGPFGGCTFARAEADGSQAVGHIFVAAVAGNDPEEQARNLERFADSYDIGSAMGFETTGLVDGGAHEGYVLGVDAGQGQGWEWFWVTRNLAGALITCRPIQPAEWVVL